MKIRVEISETDLKKIVVQYISDKTGQMIDVKDVIVETKSKQNYKSEWETAAFRAVYESTQL